MSATGAATKDSSVSHPLEPPAGDAALVTFETHRPLLFALAYRMLGSVSEAEDVLQDAYLRYCSTDTELVRSPRAFLSTVVTRLCLDQLKSACVQRERYIGPWLPEPLLTADDEGWQAPGARLDADESVSMALLVLLETLTPLERAVFLLREVFDFGYDEIAAMVGRREDACRQTFSRAKHHLANRRPRFQSSPEERQRLTSGFLQAVLGGDVEALTRMLADDITFWSDGGGKVNEAARLAGGTVAAALRPLHGRDAVARFLLGTTRKAPRGVEVSTAAVNGSPGLIVWLSNAPLTVLVLEVDGRHIREIRAIGNSDKLAHLRRTPPVAHGEA